MPSWIKPEFGQSTPPFKQQPVSPFLKEFESFAQGRHFLSGTSSSELLLQETFDAETARYHLVLRQPLNDRRLVEFALGLPDELRYQQDQTRFVMREAMRDRLPKDVLARTWKAESSTTMVESVRVASTKMVQRPSARWLDVELLQQEIADALQIVLEEPDNENNLDKFRLFWHALTLSIWQSSVSRM